METVLTYNVNSGKTLPSLSTTNRLSIDSGGSSPGARTSRHMALAHDVLWGLYLNIPCFSGCHWERVISYRSTRLCPDAAPGSLESLPPAACTKDLGFRHTTVPSAHRSPPTPLPPTASRLAACFSRKPVSSTNTDNADRPPGACEGGPAHPSQPSALLGMVSESCPPSLCSYGGALASPLCWYSPHRSM